MIKHSSGTTGRTRSAGGVLLLMAGGGLLLLVSISAILILMSDSQLSPLEQKLLGEWKQSIHPHDPSSATQYSTFFPDGTILVRESPSDPHPTRFYWKASGSEFSVDDHEPGLVRQWIVKLFGRSDETTYQILFHDENKFEIYEGTPTGDVIFERVDSP